MRTGSVLQRDHKVAPGTRRRAIVVTIVAALAALGVLLQPPRVAVQTLFLLPSMFPEPPVDPLAWLSAAPTREDLTFDYTAGVIQASVFHPAAPGRHGGIVLLLGIGDLPRSDLGVRFAAGLARTGVVVMLPESTGLLAERLTFDEVDGLIRSYDVLLSQPDVDAARVGFIGLSAAGGLSIVAAAQPALRDRIRFVNSFGGYADATQLLLDVASRSIESDGQVQPWQPQQRTIEVVAIALVDVFADPTDRDLLRRAFIDHQPVADDEWSALSPDGQRLRELLAGTGRAQARHDIRQLPAAARQRLEEISPVAYLDQLRTHVYLMHDTDDSFIPYSESRRLAAEAPGVVQRYTEFSIFAHVVPDRPVPWQTFLPDVWRLYWHTAAVLREVL